MLGVDPADADLAWRTRIGIVLQSTSDNADLSVQEVVRAFATFYPAPRDPAQVIDAVGLTEKSQARVRQLSGGQRRRLDVALGILGRPELVFLDEPTTGFDPEARRLFWDLIESLRSDGTTILLTTHYLDEAERLADRVGVILDGQILEIAPPRTLGGRQQEQTTVGWLEDGSRARFAPPSRPPPWRHCGTDSAGEIPELTVVRPSLEDVYLQMIGETPAPGPSRCRSDRDRAGRRSAAGRPGRGPGRAAWPIVRSRTSVEVKEFVRDRQALIFTFALPVMLLLIFGSVFNTNINDPGSPRSRSASTSCPA